jgi:hypothetical protein
LAADVPTVFGRPGLDASTLSALVSMDGMSGLRCAVALVAPTSWVWVTGPMRAIIDGAALGSSAVFPNSV